MYFLVLNSIFGSKYPIFGEPITIKFEKTFFQAVSTKKVCLLVLAGSTLQPVNKGRIYFLPLFTGRSTLVYYTSALQRVNKDRNKFCLCLLVGVRSYKCKHAFKTNKKKIDFCGFPTTRPSLSDWLN